jgi:hypothetical protein
VYRILLDKTLDWANEASKLYYKKQSELTKEPQTELHYWSLAHELKNNAIRILKRASLLDPKVCNFYNSYFNANSMKIYEI